MPIDAERLRSLLRYDPATGEFTWLVNRRGGARIGTRAGWIERDGNRRIGIDSLNYQNARLAVLWMTGQLPKRLVDHRNTNNSDDRWDNLRPADHSENRANSRKLAGKTPFKGVWKDGTRNQYRTAICVNGRKLHLGTFDTPEAAHARYCAAAAEHFGEFARSR